jgi:manganese/zinc/iron transport system permease protein
LSEIWIILTGALVAISCGLLGSFLLLRKMAMVGDAISHAVLPGIVISFLITGNRESLPMLIGAGIIGVITTFLIEMLHQKLKLQEDASIGVSFTFLFALGVILISQFADKIDLDQDCVLYGDLAMIPFDQLTLTSGIEMGPRAFYVSMINLMVVIAVIVLAYKEFVITTFDNSYAKIIGISATLWHYVLMSCVSFTTVTSFESVGAILVVAFLVVPAATAYLLTNKLKTMLVLSALFGLLSSVGGYYLATYFDSSIAGSMSVVAGFIFGLVFSYTKIAVRNTVQTEPTLK